ncbi:MAG: tRNA (adenosine(37)-N6)-threonylcarbamoyltransferase complex ATPase subunit type 1 TsaE [Bacillota bacterium]|nr:tRNA (adenosine(37)-N6)-threonylcarbamoyltransferase complex ATPase subunit type 1 TsaE [Bacillota bacterium]
MRVLNKDVSILAQAIVNSGKRLICLMGDLGAGKTTLTQSICGILGVEDDVVSPTFSIINVYRIPEKAGGGDVYHIDLYRIDDVSELDEIGFDDILYSDSLVIVEWADRYAHLFPDEASWIKLGIEEDGTRYAILPDEIKMSHLSS